MFIFPLLYLLHFVAMLGSFYSSHPHSASSHTHNNIFIFIFSWIYFFVSLFVRHYHVSREVLRTPIERKSDLENKSYLSESKLAQ